MRLSRSRRPETLANIFSIIAAEAPNLLNIRVGFGYGLRQGSSERHHIGYAVTRCLESAVDIVRHFIPPNIAVKWSADIHRQPRAANLDIGIAVTRERD